jgi:hypothetical protein
MRHEWAEDGKLFAVEEDGPSPYRDSVPKLAGEGFHHTHPAGDEGPLAREVLRLAAMVRELEEEHDASGKLILSRQRTAERIASMVRALDGDLKVCMEQRDEAVERGTKAYARGFADGEAFRKSSPPAES